MELNALLDKVEQLAAESASPQTVAVLTSRSNLYSFANRDVLSGDTADEDAFVKTLLACGDTGIRYVVCMWNNRELDVPSGHLRRQLEELNPKNQDAGILLSGKNGFVVKKLKALRPPK